ncbi:MAG: cysteine desulfurase [Chlorobiaceae bacterium]|nr:cysteine desulfurase [Chlorobiaceae bacterium]
MSNERNNSARTTAELLNPTFIAGVASRLFNEFPEAGSVPRNESDLLDAPGTAVSSVHGHSSEAAGFSEVGHFPWQPELPWFADEVPVREGNAFYFLPGDGTPKEAPLESHADRLTEQQAYTANTNGSYGLDELLGRQVNAWEPPGPFSRFRPQNGAALFQSPLPVTAPEGDDISFEFLRNISHEGSSAAGLDHGTCIAYELLKRAAGGVGGVDPATSDVQHQGVERYYFLDVKETRPTGASEIFDVSSVRRDFPILHQNVHGKPLAWLDNAATTQKPLSVIEAVSQFYATDNSNIHRGAHTLAARATDAYEGAREKIRRFINAGSASEIIYVRGTTEGINLVAQTWGRKFIQPGDEIVLSILEHHANIVPWQMFAREKGAVIRVVPVDDRGEILMEEYTRLLGPRTRLVSLTQASNGLGTILPVREMIRLARRYDTKVLVDGAQSVAHIPVDVQDLDVDFFVFSGHKIFAPTGIGALYGKRELLELMPPWQGGGNMIKDVRFEETIYNEAPAKFEAGTPSIGDAVGLGAALDYVRKIGLENIARYEHELTRYGTARLQAIPGLRLLGTAREKVGVLSFVLDGVPNDEVGRLLDREGIAVRTGHHCTQPSLRRFGVEGTVRPSLAFYNTKEEIDRLANVVGAIRRR